MQSYVSFRQYRPLMVLIALLGCPSFLFSDDAKPQASPKPSRPLVRSEALLPKVARDESNELFDGPAIPELRLKLEKTAADLLRQDGRQYVKCELTENGSNRQAVALKLKGAAGSYQDLDSRPAFTINVSKFDKRQRFHGLKKFYLNNSVQDESYFCEWLSARICREINLPAPRITFARVFLDDRDLGLYVFKEGFDDYFIKRHFVKSDGFLLDGGFCQDIDSDLEEDIAAADKKQPGLIQLREACLEPDDALRNAAVERQLNVDAFISLMAFEMMACHWDGYAGNCNNYRIYIPSSGGAWFLPHGMDQMFQDPNYSVFEPRNPIVGRVVRGREEWNQLYRRRVAEILPNFEPKKLIRAIEQLDKRLRPLLRELDPNIDARRNEIVEEWRNRLRERFTNIELQLTLPDPEPAPEEMQPLQLEIGQKTAIANWYPRQECDEVSISEEEVEAESAEDPPVIYSIAVEGSGHRCIASWRRGVLLPQGNYRFSAELKVKDVQVFSDDDRGIGAGVRISGSRREQSFSGTREWSDAHFDFSILEEFQWVELVSELRASAGMLKMRKAKLTRLEPQ